MSSRKRSAPSPAFTDDATSPAASKGRQRLTQVEREERKKARMERNRVAAQISRDRKKQRLQELENKLEELETVPMAIDDTEMTTLRRENAALKLDNDVLRADNQTMKARLTDLEAKCSRIDELEARLAALAGIVTPQSLQQHASPSLEPMPDVTSSSVSPSTSKMEEMIDQSCDPAVIASLPRTLIAISSLSTSTARLPSTRHRLHHLPASVTLTRRSGHRSATSTTSRPRRSRTTSTCLPLSKASRPIRLFIRR